ncbi:ABC transporter, partial [Trypanosoma grayi]|uniref:ABC transporter n=1 Tax=Trypanosoma grayi TaxID=71804 RepID=UPI0004F43FC1
MQSQVSMVAQTPPVPRQDAGHAGSATWPPSSSNFLPQGTLGDQRNRLPPIPGPPQADAAPGGSLRFPPPDAYTPPPGATVFSREHTGRIPRGKFFVQLGSTMRHVCLLRWRSPCSMCCEIMTPFLFVFGTVLLWGLFRNEQGSPGNYFDSSAPKDYRAAMDALHASVCYNASMGEMSGVPSCNLSEPGKLLCVDGDDFLAGLCCGAKEAAPLFIFSNMLGGRTAATPTFDDVALLRLLKRTRNWRLYFAPVSAATAALVEYFNTSSRYFRYVYGGTYGVDAAESLARDNPPIWGIVQVSDMSPEKFDVTIRLNASELPGTKKMRDEIYIGGLNTGSGELYISSGFITLQSVVSSYYLNRVVQVPNSEILMYTPAPTAAYDTQPFFSVSGELVPLIVVMGFLYPVSQLTRRLVLEKELRIREAVLIMGLSEGIMY